MSDGGDREPGGARNGGGWFDDPARVRLVLRLLYGACAVLVLLDLARDRHGHFEIESLPGFYALFGFAAFLAIVWLGKQLRRLVQREEDYYDR